VEEQISKTKIDRLGDRLRLGNITDADLRLLDDYRRSFSRGYDIIAGTIRHQLGLEPTGRPAKSTTSIAEKLHRESIRLTQIQDIAGCRLIVEAIAEQERVISALTELFKGSTVIDRREKPSHGYRAVHVIVNIDKKPVEIQVRTALQQLWAEMSEKLSDLFDPAIKYGGGKDHIKTFLSETSGIISEHEGFELSLLQMQSEVQQMLSEANLTEDKRASIINFQMGLASHQANLESARENALKILKNAFDKFEEE
jgi:putative GTP pyrophosphokinase